MEDLPPDSFEPAKAATQPTLADLSAAQGPAEMKKHLPYGDWPEADRRLFEVSFQGADDPFDDAAGAGAHLRPRTVRTLRYGYARWLSWLAAEAPSALSDDPQHRVTPERIKSYSSALGKTMKPSSVATYVAWLLHAVIWRLKWIGDG